MASKFQTAERLSDRLEAGSQFDSSQTLAIIGQLASELAAIHAAGRLCRNIQPDRVILDADGARLTADEPTLDSDFDNDSLPPEIQSLRIPHLPDRLDDAAAALRKAGVEMDPRRIDLYQLGCVACQMLTGRSAKTYLFSPRGKAAVPPKWRCMIDGMLGYDPAVRINSCDELVAQMAGLEQAPANAKKARSIDTPPRGTGIDVMTNTPRVPHPTAQPFVPNKLGHFEIGTKLGSGGMGDVYQARDVQLERTVALKVLPLELARQSDFVRRFVEEAKAAAQLVHPNIVQIYLIGEDRGHHYFVMQYVAGETLAERLKRQKRLSLDDALAIIAQVLSGLAIAHGQGMIHRDIKPGNILLDTAHGRALLADFGLVKSLDASEQMTATGMVMGTVDYISPEQGRGHKVDTRSDLYSVGVLLYQLLSGQLPFVAESATAMIFQHAYEKPRALEEVAPDVPAGASAIIDRLLAKNPADRYQTADELLADIRTLQAAHDWKPTPQQRASEPRKTAIVVAPNRDALAEDERGLAAALAPLPRARWKDKLRVFFHLHAPELLKNLQNTEQQVDGAVAVYQARRDKLAQLAHEAASIERLLADQGLETELEQQQAEREQIERRLGTADATLQKLRTQQALLRARLRAAQAAKVLSDVTSPALATVRPRQVRAALIGVGLLAALFALVLCIRLQRGLREPEKTILASSSGTRAAATPPAGAILPVAGWFDVLPFAQLEKGTGGDVWEPLSDGVRLVHQSGPSPVTRFFEIPVLLRGSYELKFKYLMEADRHHGYTVRFPVGTARASLTLGAIRGSKGLGINGIHGLDALSRANPTCNPNYLSRADVEHDALLHVEHAVAGAVHLQFSIDGAKEVDWSGNEADVKILDTATGTKLSRDPILILHSWGKSATFRQLAVRMLDGWAERGPAAANAPTTPSPSAGSEPSTKAEAPAAPAPRSSKNIPPVTIQGRFYVVCKGDFEFYLNGNGIFQDSGTPYSGISNVHTIHDNDVLLVRTTSGFVYRAIRFAFVSQDGHWIWAPRRQDFRVVPGDDPKLVVANVINSASNVPEAARVDPNSEARWLSLTDERAGEWISAGNKGEWLQFGTVVHLAAFRYVATPHNAYNILTSDDWEWSPPANAGPEINSATDDASPFISADGLTLLFESKRSGGYGGIDLWTAQRPSVDQPWGKPANLGPEVNSADDDYHPSMTADGRNLIFSSNRPGGVGKADVYFSGRASVTQPWGKPINMGRPINSQFMERGSCISSDSMTLIIGSDRPTGTGRNDLWITHRRTPTERWGRFENMGAIVNSPLADRSPNLSTDGLVLVFHSDRAGGLGRNDIYMCTRASIDDAFGPPVNLGPTINASGNEEHPSISSDGKTLWFSSPRDGGFGHYDIWYSKRVKKRAAKLATSESGKSSASTTASRQFAVPAAETDAPTSPKN